MPHFSRLGKVVVDVPGAEAGRAAEFWQGVIGTDLTALYQDFPEYVGSELPYAPELTFLVQRLEDGHPRVHLDIHTDDLEAEVARLEGLGAVRVHKVESWWVMGDPGGLVFCVLPVEAGTLSEENAVRWD